MKSIFHDVSFIFASRVVVLALTVGVQSFLAWSLGPADRGSLAVCQIFALVLFMVFTVGINASGIYFVSSKNVSLSEGIANIIAICAASSLLAIICGILVMEIRFPFFLKADRSSFYVSLLTIPSLVFSISIVSILTAVDEFRWYALMSSVNSVILLFFTVLFVGRFRLGVNGALWATVLEGVLSTVFVLVYLRLKHRIILVIPSIEKMKLLFLYGIRYHLGKISNFANMQLGTMFMAFFASKIEVGYFAVAAQAVSKINVIPDTLMTVLLPKVSADREGKRNVIARSARLTFLLCAAILAVIVIAAKPLVSVLFSPAFHGAVPIIQILSMGFLFRSSSKVFEPYLLGTNKPGSVSLSSAVSAIVNFLLIWALMPYFGASGAAVGTSLAYFVGGVILLLSFKKHSEYGLFQIVGLQKADVDYFTFLIRRLAGKRDISAL